MTCWCVRNQTNLRKRHKRHVCGVVARNFPTAQISLEISHIRKNGTGKFHLVTECAIWLVIFQKMSHILVLDNRRAFEGQAFEVPQAAEPVLQQLRSAVRAPFYSLKIQEVTDYEVADCNYFNTNIHFRGPFTAAFSIGDCELDHQVPPVHITHPPVQPYTVVFVQTDCTSDMYLIPTAECRQSWLDLWMELARVDHEKTRKREAIDERARLHDLKRRKLVDGEKKKHESSDESEDDEDDEENKGEDLQERLQQLFYDSDDTSSIDLEGYLQPQVNIYEGHVSIEGLISNVFVLHSEI